MVVLLLPDSAGARLLGETWPHAEPLLPVLVVFWIAIGATLGATQGLLALGAAKRSLFTQVAGLAIQLPLMAAGAAVDGAAGAAVAAGLTAILRMLLAWAQFGRAVGERPTAAGEMARPQPLPEIATP
jgi:O-antigen/teichoic acid export membrane protein